MLIERVIDQSLICSQSTFFPHEVFPKESFIKPRPTLGGTPSGRGARKLRNTALDSASLRKITTRVSTMKALRMASVFQVDTLGGNNTCQPAVDSGSGELAGGNTAFPDFRHMSCSSHTPCGCGEPLFQRSCLCCDFMWTQ